MTRILIQGEGSPPTERELKPGTATIGRKSDNDFHLEDATVSGHHAKIVTYFQSSYIEDLGSTNGTFVNGRRVRMHTLHGGDIISIGRFELRFGTAPAPAEPPTLGADATICMAREESVPVNPPGTGSPAPSPAVPAVSEPAPVSSPAEQPSADSPAATVSTPAPAAGAFFQIMVGERAGQRLPVPEHGLELLPGVRVQREGESFVVHRAAQPQGVVRLNSRDLSPGGVTLKDMDMLQVNSAWMAFFSS